MTSTCCYISCFYIKPQLHNSFESASICCYISCFYIKPQQTLKNSVRASVATFLVSTSNRNGITRRRDGRYVATFLVSTSNRNIYLMVVYLMQLLHFLFLHQTATDKKDIRSIIQLLHFLFLHQTATFDRYIIQRV